MSDMQLIITNLYESGYSIEEIEMQTGFSRDEIEDAINNQLSSEM